jgi:hypothetical protein
MKKKFIGGKDKYSTKKGVVSNKNKCKDNYKLIEYEDYLKELQNF